MIKRFESKKPRGEAGSVKSSARKAQAIEGRSAGMIAGIAILLAGVVFIGYCARQAPVVEPISPGECPSLPANVVITDAELNVASVQLRELSIGGLEFSTDTKVVELVSKGAVASQVAEFLLCEAQRRGDVNREDTARVDYLREGLMFMSTGPTPDQVREYQKEHRPPPPRTGKVEIPQIREDQGKLVLRIESVPPVQSFRVINSGEAKIRFWFAQIPTERLYITEAGPVDLSPGEFIDGKMILVEFNGSAPGDLPIELRTAQPESSREILVRIPDMAQVAAAYREMAGELMTELVASAKADPTFSAPGGGGGGADALAAQLVARVAQTTVYKKWPDLSAADSIIVAGTLLEASSWPQAAAALYRTAEENKVLEGPLLARSIARAEYFSQSLNAQATDKQKTWVQFVAAQGRPDGAVLLQLASLNPLVADQNVTEANAAVSALSDIAAFRSYSHTLRADLALSQGDLNEAVKLYTACQRRFMFRTCTLRKAEAQLLNNDVEEAKLTIEGLGQSSSAADALVFDRAMRQLQMKH